MPKDGFVKLIKKSNCIRYYVEFIDINLFQSQSKNLYLELLPTKS